MQNLAVFYIKKGNEMIPATEQDILKLSMFSSTLKEGEKIEVYLQRKPEENQTLGQLAKVHALIRELALEIGVTHSQMKIIVKEKAGIYDISESSSNNKIIKSFAKCSKQEMTMAIQTCIEIGHYLGCNLY